MATSTPRTKATAQQEDTIRQLLAAGLIAEARKIVQAYNCTTSLLPSEQTIKALEKFITEDEDLIKVKEMIKILSNEQDTVLILGETGTGKELLARALHSDREGKFLSLNCAALPRELIESELFGHIAGSFTGAIKDRIGILQAANGGTVFLDEIGELPMLAQAAMLRTLQEKTIRKVGSNVEEGINCRIVCATWHDLGEEVKGNRFRNDLFYRLNRIVLKTKPLRDRPADINEIIDSLDKGRKVNEDMIEQIKELPLHGNVRELENLIRRIELFGSLD